MLPNRMATANEPDNPNVSDECSICLVPLSQPGLDVYTTACQHRFHFQCLAKNVQAQNNECPLCRTRLDSLVNILTPPATTPTPVAVENVPAQHVAAPETQLTQQAAPVQTTSTVENAGVWNALTRSFKTVFGWAGNASAASTASTTEKKKTSPWSFSAFTSSPEDLIDENAVRALSARITAARQQSIDGQAHFPLITATTTLEFGAQESTKESNIYGMVSLKAPSLLSKTASETELDELHVPIDLVCVIDQSGSMQGEKIRLVKDTLAYIIEQMGVHDRLAVISFNTSAKNQSNGLKLMTPEKKQGLRTIIDRDINAQGGTYIGSGLEMAIQLLQNRQTINPLGALLLLTDGQDNQPHDYSALMETLPENVVCHTFGYGSGHNAGLLSQIAEQGHGGTFTYIDQTDAIGPAFATALGGIFTCIAKQVRINLEFDDEYTVTHTHTTYQYEPKNLPSRRVTFKMNDLNADESRNLVFQLHVPTIESTDENNSDDHIVGRVSLEYRDANTDQTVRTPPVSFTLARPNQIDPQSPLLQVNYTLDVQRNRAETSEVLKRAVNEADYRRARDMINAQLDKIRSSASAADPLCQQLIRDLEYQYSNQHEFQTTMTNMYMQHGQERATYSTGTTISAGAYMTCGQERYRSKWKS